MVRFEFSKVLKKQFSAILLGSTIILFPIIIKIISHLNIVKDGVPEGLFPQHVAYGVLGYSQLYFFLPVWIIIFIGLELSNGHASRVVFAKSKRFYFLLKLTYCGIISIFFSLLGLISLLIALETSPFQELNVTIFFYLDFLSQMMLLNLTFSIFLLNITFIFRSAMATFTIYLVWSFVEGIIFTALESIYNLKVKWLPLHLIKSLYVRDGDASIDNYFSPLREDFTLLFTPISFVLILTLIVYKYFLKSDLKPLTD